MNESSIAPPVRKQKPNAQQCSYIYDRDLPLYTSCLSTPFASLKKKSTRVQLFGAIFPVISQPKHHGCQPSILTR